VVEGSVGATSNLLRFVDGREQYGRHVVSEFSSTLRNVRTVCDIGVGMGVDLGAVQEHFPDAEYFGIDFSAAHEAELAAHRIALQVLDLESDELGFDDESVDVFIANQVYEHLKEIFWVSHQLSKKLKVGGAIILGVPNICALHNRVLFNLGFQPSQMKSYSAHVRGFAPREIPKFFEVCFPGGYELVRFAGAQFYPFARPVSRVLSKVFPSLADSVFYLFVKKKQYQGEFIEHPVRAQLETNFHIGQR